MRSNRIEEIREYILENKTLTLDQICKEFDISKSTLRRDLNDIMKAGNIQKTYGGVTTIPEKGLISFEERNIAHLEEKKRIASAAAQLVNDNDIIFIDSGTTTFHILEYIEDRKNITVLTNNVEILFRAIPYNNINVIALSGLLNRKTLSLTGCYATQVLQNYNISKAFMAATGFSVANGATNSSPLESDIKRVAVERSQAVYLLADKSKCGFVSLITYCSLSKIDVLITDGEPTPDIRRYMEQSGKKILISR